MIFLKLFYTFFKIGLFTFGGGYAMIPLIQSEVLRFEGIEMKDIMDFIAISESTPGPFAINVATFVGSEVGGATGVMQGVFGSACTTLGVVLPSFIIILIVAKCYEQFKTNRIVKGCMTGLKPAVIGLIGSAALTMVKTVFFSEGIKVDVLKTVPFYISLVLFVAMTALVLKKKIHPIIIICISAVVGIITGFALGM